MKIPTAHPAHPASAPAMPMPMPEPAFISRVFTPDDYQERYAYPLVVLFHQHGGNEDRAIDLVPRMSRRNFFAVSLRGPQLLGVREDGSYSCGWGQDGQYADVVNQYVRKAVNSVRRAHNIHTERVFFVGVCEGATAAYRAAFAMPEAIGGVCALNGQMPKVTPGSPLFQFRSLRKMRVMISHGIENQCVPLSQARRDYKLFYAAGANVRLRTYLTNHRLHQEMLNDVNRWIIGAINVETDRLVKVGR
jgi:phospholipase/carboxylesterase